MGNHQVLDSSRSWWAAEMIHALRHYPSRATILGILGIMSSGDRILGLQGRESLRQITGQDFGGDIDAWADWWRDEGNRLWP